MILKEREKGIQDLSPLPRFEKHQYEVLGRRNSA
jgi:hypothetical protein